MADRVSAARLYVLSGPDLGRSFPLGERTTLGRSDECDLVLRERSISRQHAVLVQTGERWFVEDLGSTNGISKDGKRAPRIELADGDEFKLGDLLLRLRLGAPAAPSASEQDIEFDVGPASTRATAAAPIPAPPPRPGPPSVTAAADEIEIEEPDAEPAASARAPLAPSAPRVPRPARRTGFFAADFGQQPFWLRTLVVLLLLFLCTALAYGAFRAVGLLRAG